MYKRQKRYKKYKRFRRLFLNHSLLPPSLTHSHTSIFLSTYLSLSLHLSILSHSLTHSHSHYLPHNPSSPQSSLAHSNSHWSLFFTARSEERGLAAIEALKKEGLSPKFHALDVTDKDSILRLRDFLQENYGGLDLLVNNAGIAISVRTNSYFRSLFHFCKNK